MNINLLLALINKEFIHIRRDVRSLFILFLMPLLMIFIFGYAIDMDLKHIRLGVYDLSRTPKSRDLIRKLESSDYFKTTLFNGKYFDTANIFKERKVRAVLIIPADFIKEEEDSQGKIALIIDGSDANTASIIQNYAESFLITYSSNVSPGGTQNLPIKIQPRIFYNPEMKSAVFTVPGIIAILMIMIGALLTSVTIVREKETGTLEQMLVSPIRGHEIILGKAIPYFFLAFMIALFITLFGYFWFEVPFQGSPLLLALLCSIYLFTSLSLGLFISTLASTQQVAMMIALIATLLPSVMLSGFIFPIASMPPVLRFISQLVPATHFLVIIRGIMLKGNGINQLMPSVLSMTAITLFFMVLAVKRFKLKLM